MGIPAGIPWGEFPWGGPLGRDPWGVPGEIPGEITGEIPGGGIRGMDRGGVPLGGGSLGMILRESLGGFALGATLGGSLGRSMWGNPGRISLGGTLRDPSGWIPGGIPGWIFRKERGTTLHSEPDKFHNSPRSHPQGTDDLKQDT